MLYFVLTFFILFVIAAVIIKAAAINRLTSRAPCSLILIPACGDDELLEQRVRAFHAEQMFCDGRYKSEIIIVITGARYEKTAVQLAEQLEGVTAVCLGELEEYISTNYKEYRFTDS